MTKASHEEAVGLGGPEFHFPIEQGKVREFARTLFAFRPDYLEDRHPPMFPTLTVVAGYSWGYMLEDPCMTGFHPLDQEVIHSSWGREIVDNRSDGRVSRSMVPTRFRSPARARTGGRGAEVKRSPRRRVGPLSPWLCRAVLELGRPAFLDVPRVLNGCMGLNRIIARRGARDDG